MKNKYECVGIFPLEFADGQQVESGEMFERDFEATTGTQHELWLIQNGMIREVLPPSKVTKTPSGNLSGTSSVVKDKE